MRLNNLLYKPVVTEKTYSQVAEGVYTFKVALDASKETVAKEVEKIYGVDVVAVRSIIMPGKTRRISGTRRFAGKDKWKKVILKLKEGQTIDVMPKE
jgi:large subunit ribosomal protein L23